MKVLYFSSGTFGLRTLEAIAASRHRVVSVVTVPEKPRGRGKKILPSEVRVLADQLKLPVLSPGKPNAPESLEIFRAMEADVYGVVSYGRILSQEFLDLPPA
ncbi:MAG: methionyl-tRNA formyltransferase, partial [Candidatus Omnitrophica bacterium]|nr:methionyl-tRNA formyltransferase [Candidatus Omnitrophota bacterium]